MKKITILFVLLFMGMATMNAQLQPRKKVIKKAPSTTALPKDVKDLKNPKKVKDITRANDYIRQQEQLKKLERESFKSGSYGSPTSGKGSKTLEIISDNFDSGYNAEPQSQTENLNCTNRIIDVNANTITFGQVSTAKTGAPDWMKPGVILKASDFLRGRHKMETMKRHPIIYSTNLSGYSQVARTVERPEEPSNLTIAINNMKARSTNTASANITLNYEEIHSLDELNFKLMGKYTNTFGTVSASLGLDYGTKKERHYYMIDYTQNMFHIDVDPKEVAEVFIDPDQPVKDLIYISRVVYGRRGIVVVESKLDVKEFGMTVEASMKTLFGSGELKAGINTLNKDDDFRVYALIYGGDTGSGTNSLLATVKGQKPDISEWAKKNPGNPKLAEPIGYEVKNMNNEPLGMRSNFKRPVETCLPILTETVKLKVTLTDLICAESKDGGGNGDDYGLNQYIVYKVKGKEQQFLSGSRDINKFPDRINEEGINKKQNKNQLINGNKANQIHVRESRVRNTNVNNSMVFEITPQALNDSNTKFEINTWLKEYTGSNDEVLTANNGAHGYKRINVKLKEVIDYLLRPSDFSNDFNDSCFNWTTITDQKCKPLGTKNADLWLVKATNGVVDAPISLGRKDARGAVWMRFELVE